MKRSSETPRGKQKKTGSPLHAVILAGGAGERFWPASRRKRPKPLMRVVGGESLLAATVAR
ncbi:MAG: sugar phosphate nucleotidyltransferase, partial [Myxococcota bacterium]|nr:sugar phosphate nucleotidyltransferase [Myxococcota bacterium]